MSRRSHGHNRATDDDLYGNWAARDPPSGSYSGYVAGNSYTQHGSYDRGYGGSSHAPQSSYYRSGSDPNYGNWQQQQQQEQSGGYGSQISQGYESEEDDIRSIRSSIMYAKNASISSTSNGVIAARTAEANSPRTLERLAEGERFLYTGANDRTALNNEFASGNPFSSQTRAQEEEARIVARQQQREREERNRAREFARHNRVDVSRYQFDDDYGMEDEIDPGLDQIGHRSHGRRRF